MIGGPWGLCCEIDHCVQALRECFETKNVALLQTVLSDLPQDLAAYHMDRCIKSGLWVSDAKAAGKK